jgi:hypothetical protein
MANARMACDWIKRRSNYSRVGGETMKTDFIWYLYGNDFIVRAVTDDARNWLDNVAFVYSLREHLDGYVIPQRFADTFQRDTEGLEFVSEYNFSHGFMGEI